MICQPCPMHLRSAASIFTASELGAAPFGQCGSPDGVVGERCGKSISPTKLPRCMEPIYAKQFVNAWYDTGMSHGLYRPYCRGNASICRLTWQTNVIPIQSPTLGRNLYLLDHFTGGLRINLQKNDHTTSRSLPLDTHLLRADEIGLQSVGGSCGRRDRCHRRWHR